MASKRKLLGGALASRPNIQPGGFMKHKVVHSDRTTDIKERAIQILRWSRLRAERYEPGESEK